MKALIITGHLVQDHEFIYPYYRLKEAGFEVLTVLEAETHTIGSLGTRIPSDKDAEVIDYGRLLSYNLVGADALEEYDLLVLPGGAKCMEYLRQNKVVLDFIYKWNLRGKIIASICHAAQLLISAKVVKGRKISGYYSIKDDIENAGAIYVDAPAVVDSNIVSCPHYKYLGEWMKKTLEVVDASRKTSS